MPLKHYRPTTSGKRLATVDTFEDITKTSSEKSLRVIKKKTGGRNAQGRITVRHRGGGVKQYIRIIDYKQDRFDIPATVRAIEYDPNRSARIALVVFEDGVKRYLIAPQNLKVGDMILSSQGKLKPKLGNRMPLEHIPVGVSVYNIELSSGKGGQLVRSAGTLAQIMAIQGDYAHIKLPSGEVRLIRKGCMATVGEVSNPDRRHIRLGKAGRMRLLGIRPTVRGKVMNPVDHPHGGGEGRNPIGLKHPKTPWGKPALGVPTRRNKRSNRFIVSARKRRKR